MPCEREALNSDGDRVLVRMHPYRDESQQDAGVVLTFVDVTRQRWAEESLLNTDTDLRLRLTAIEAAHDMIIITDRDGVILDVNPAFARITGYSRDEAVGRPVSLLKSGEHDASFFAEQWKAVLSGRVWRGRMTNRRKDGTIFQEHAMITPLFDPLTNEVTHFVAIKQLLDDAATHVANLSN